MLPKADGIVALTGGDERLDTAVALLERGVGKRLLVSGVAPETTKETVGKMSDGGPRFACCADIGYAAEDTHGNAEEAADWTREHHFASLVIVTGRYHMPRTMKEFSAATARRDPDRLSGGAKPHRSGRLVAASAHRPAAAPRICQISRQPGDHAAGAR